MSRILVAEDDNRLAMETSWTLEKAGYSVVGPEMSVAATLQVLARLEIDLALLDLKLGGETVLPILVRLDALAVPFIFITCIQASAMPATYRHRPSMAKAHRPQALVALIRKILGA